MATAATVALTTMGCSSTAPTGDGLGDGGSSPGTAGDPSDPSDPTATSGADATGDGSASGTGDSDGDSVVLDVGPGGGPGGMDGCAKVDFLFVIDNSGSMSSHQQSLVASFPGFITAIQATLTAQDYQVMVVDTDSIADGLGDPVVTCSPDPGCCVNACAADPGAKCNGVVCTPQASPSGCHDTLGGGKLADLAGNDCGVVGGARFVTSAQPDLAGTFACLAEVGTDGHADEKPMGAMMAAVSSSMNGSGGCNEGFIRDDAILVVAFVTDAPPLSATEQETGTPAAWYDAVVAAKGGNADAVAVVGLLPDANLPGGVCPAAFPPLAAPAYQDFVALWGARGIIGSVCENDYAPIFAAAIGLIDTTCDEFDPVG